MDINKVQRDMENKYQISLDFIIDTQGIQCLVKNGFVSEKIKVTETKPTDKISYYEAVKKFLIYELENYLICRGGRVSPTHKHRIVPKAEIERMNKRDPTLSFRAYPKRLKNDKQRFKWLNIQLKNGTIDATIYFDLAGELDLEKVR